MSRPQRVTKLEHALATRDSVLLWLEEVRRFPSVVDYARATLDRPDGGMPLERILERVVTAVGERTKGTDAARAQRAIRQESRDAVFLYALVVELNQAAWNLTRDWAPIALALTAQLRCLAADPLSSDAAAAAQTEVEARYFTGRSVLFAEAADELASTQALADRVSQLMVALPTPLRARVPERSEARTDGLTQRVAARVATVTEDARISAFQLLGEPLRAASLVKRHLREASEIEK